MPVALDLNVLSQCGMKAAGTPAEQKAYFDFMAAFTAACRIEGRSIYGDELNAAINQDLAAAQLLLAAAAENAQEFLRVNGLKLRSDQKFIPRWDPRRHCWAVELQIDGTPEISDSQNYHGYAGRKIIIRVATRATNNNFDAQDVLNKIAQIKSAAMQAAEKIRNPHISKIINDLEQQTLNAIAASLREQLSSGVSDPSKFSNLSLGELFNELLRVNQLDQALEIAQEKIQWFYTQLAVELIAAENLNPEYNPNEQEISAKIAALSAQEIKTIETNLRPIIIDAYLQKNEVAETSHSPQAILTRQVPLSDETSESRELNKLFTPNSWEVTINKVALYLANQTFTTTFYRRLYRSTSLAHLTEGKRDTLREQESLENLIIKKARDEVVRRINLGERVDPNLIIKTFYQSLLSPFIEKGMLTKAISTLNDGGKLGQTVHEKNELEQLKSLREALEKVKHKDLKFSEADVQYIEQHTQTAASRPSKEQLKAVRIQHKFFYFNFVVNSFKGVHTNRLDFANNNHRHNLLGLIELNEHLQAQLLDARLPQLAKLFAPKLNKGAIVDETSKEWTTRKRLIETEIARLNNPDVVKVLELYIAVRNAIAEQAAWIQSTTELSPDQENSMLAKAMVASEQAAQLADALDFITHAFCKSGKDRTAIFVANAEAFAAGVQYLIVNISRALRLPLAIKHIPVLNGGARSIQVDSNLYDGLRTVGGTILLRTALLLRVLLEGWHARAVGGFSRKCLECDKAIAQQVRANLPTNAGSSFIAAASSRLFGPKSPESAKAQSPKTKETTSPQPAGPPPAIAQVRPVVPPRSEKPATVPVVTGVVQSIPSPAQVKSTAAPVVRTRVDSTTVRDARGKLKSTAASPRPGPGPTELEQAYAAGLKSVGRELADTSELEAHEKIDPSKLTIKERMELFKRMDAESRAGTLKSRGGSVYRGSIDRHDSDPGDGSSNTSNTGGRKRKSSA